MEPLSIDGAWVFAPRIFDDSRGSFLEWYRSAELEKVLGYQPEVAQANCSGRWVIRGIHFADLPPGQAKYVTCVSGAITDVVVDTRVGSPSYGRWEAVRLNETERNAYSRRLGHAFVALTDDAVVMYLCSTPYAPGASVGCTRSTRRSGSRGLLK